MKKLVIFLIIGILLMVSSVIYIKIYTEQEISKGLDGIIETKKITSYDSVSCSFLNFDGCSISNIKAQIVPGSILNIEKTDVKNTVDLSNFFSSKKFKQLDVSLYNLTVDKENILWNQAKDNEISLKYPIFYTELKNIFNNPLSLSVKYRSFNDSGKIFVKLDLLANVDDIYLQSAIDYSHLLDKKVIKSVYFKLDAGDSIINNLYYSSYLDEYNLSKDKAALNASYGNKLNKEVMTMEAAYANLEKHSLSLSNKIELNKNNAIIKLLNYENQLSNKLKNISNSNFIELKLVNPNKYSVKEFIQSGLIFIVTQKLNNILTSIQVEIK